MIDCQTEQNLEQPDATEASGFPTLIDFRALKVKDNVIIWKSSLDHAQSHTTIKTSRLHKGQNLQTVSSEQGPDDSYL